MNGKRFLELRNRYVLHCSLHSEEALHVGTGIAGVKTDAPFILQSGKPFLPGSSLRGVMRSNLERILQTLVPGECCTLFEETPADVCVAGNTDKRKEFESATGEGFNEMRDKLKLCMVCELFGSTLNASKLKVTDAIPRGSEPKLIRRDSVGIDRDTEAARDKLKFDFEVLERGCYFDFQLLIENADQTDFGLLYILLKELEYGIDVGGRKARGLGRVMMTEYSVKYFDATNGHSLREFLKDGLKDMEVSAFLNILTDGFAAACAPPKEAVNVPASNQ